MHFLSIKKIVKKIPFHPSFFLLVLWFILTKNFYSFLLFFVVVLSHEFGHYFVAKKCGYKLNSFYIAPFGVNLNYKEKVFDSKDEIFIALAGPMVNFFLSIVLISFWWIFPESYNFTYEFVIQSLMLGLFNLLPCYPLDGGRVAVSLLSKNMPRKKAVKFICLLNYIFASILFVFFILSCFINFNPTFALCAVFLVLGQIDSKNECQYMPVLVFNKKVKSYSKPIFLVINSNETLSNMLKHIESNKFTIFIALIDNRQTKLIDENFVKQLSLTYPINASLKDIFKQERE